MSVLDKNVPEGLSEVEETKLVGSLILVSLVLSSIIILFRWNVTNVSTWESGAIATNIISGHGFSYAMFGQKPQPTSIMAPFYPYLLATVYYILGKSTEGYLLIQIFQALIHAGTVSVTYLIARDLFSRGVGFLSGLGMALFPDYLFSVTVIHQLTITTFCIVMLVYSLLRVQRDFSSTKIVISGLFLGITALVFPAILFYSPFIAVWLIWDRYRSGDIHSGISGSVALAICSFVIISPWTLRNYIVHDQFVLIKQMGFNFWRGNTPPAIRTGLPNSREDIPEPLLNELSSMRQVTAGKVLQEQAFEYILAHPWDFLGAYLTRMWYFWWFPPSPQDLQATILRKIVYAPVLISGVGGLVLSRSNYKRLLPIYLLLVAFTLGYAFFFVLPRYHTPTIQPFLIIFGAYFISVLYNNICALGRDRWSVLSSSCES